MNTSLHPALESYLLNTFSPEKLEEITDSLLIFDAFEYQGFYASLDTVLFDPQSENEDVGEYAFLGLLDQCLNTLLDAHGLTTHDETPQHFKNLLLQTLYRLQYLEDPVPLLRILETDQPDEVKLSRIIAAISPLDETLFHTYVVEVPSRLIETLTAFLYHRELLLSPEDTVIAPPALLQTLTDYFTFIGTDNIVYRFMQEGVRPGYPARVYYPYFREHLLVDSVAQTAQNLLAYFLFCQDTYQDPVRVFREKSEQFFTDHDRLLKVQDIMSTSFSQLRQYQEAQRASASLS